MLGEIGLPESATKRRLLEAASEFGRSSYMEASVAPILARAGVQAPTLYHHFKDKEGLFVEWAVSAVKSLGQAVEETESTNDLAGRLTAIAGLVSDSEHPDLIQLMRDVNKLERPESRERVIQSLQEALYEPLYAILLTAMSQGRLRQEPVHSAAAVFLTGAVALRPGGTLRAAGGDAGPSWWVERFLGGFAVG